MNFYNVQDKDSSKIKKICSSRLFQVFTFILVTISILILITSITLILIFKNLNSNSQNKTTSNNISVSIKKNISIKCKYGYSGDKCDECGLNFKQANVKIVGGIEAVSNSWPWTVLFLFNFKTNAQIPNTNRTIFIERAYICAGTLIDRQTILTAAHCIVEKIDFKFENKDYYVKVEPNFYYKTVESMYKIYAGLHSKQVLDKNELSLGKAINKIIVHPSYNKFHKLNDIAIVKLTESIELNDNIQLACLPDQLKTDYPSDFNIDIWAVGWGTLNYNGPTPNVLYNVKLKLYDPNVYCKKVLSEYEKNWNSQLCVGYLAGGKDTCQGDSGGAIFVKDTVNNSTKFIAVGIVSYGDGCGKANKPGIYTKIWYYLDWIYENS